MPITCILFICVWKQKRKHAKHYTHSLKMYDKSLGSLGKIDLWQVYKRKVEVEQIAKGKLSSLELQFPFHFCKMFTCCGTVRGYRT